MTREEILKKARAYLKMHADLFGNEMWFTRYEGDPTATDRQEEDKEVYENMEGKTFSADPAHPANGPFRNLGKFNEAIRDCQRCPLGKTRTKFVFGVGNPKAKLVLVGEAPGRDEDLQGEPFVGRAGQLLNKILGAISLERKDVYICNILKCRPPNNRDPQEDEVEQCEPYLLRQLSIINPKIIVCLGRIAAQNLMKTTLDLKNLRGKIHDYNGIQMIVTYHPAALLRNPNLKRATWDDFQKVQKLYEEA